MSNLWVRLWVRLWVKRFLQPHHQIEKTPRTYRHKGFRLLVSSHVLLALPIVNACAEHILGFRSDLMLHENRIKSTVFPAVVSNGIKAFQIFVGKKWATKWAIFERTIL